MTAHYSLMMQTVSPVEIFKIADLTPAEQQLLVEIRRRKTELLHEIQQLKDEIAEVTAEMESMDNGEESKNAARAKQLSLGRKKFNMDPKKGIEFLVQQGLLQNTPQDISAFLYRGEGLNKTAIGDYLGEKSPFHEQVLKAFVDLHDFTDLIIVQALRQFLWSFRLPGEAQKIDRMMETFAQRYCQLNPNIFSNPDTCYVLSFAVIILNTSLHNPSVKEKPTLEKFITMNRGINDGKDLPRDILESLYDSIKAEPFKIPEDDGNDLMHTFFNPDREGWLWKQGGRYKSWKRRWFILNDNCLYYFEYTTDKEPRGIIPLENIQVREVIDRNKPNCFELYATGGNDFIKACKTDSEGKVVEGKHTVYRMSAAELGEKDEWIACIRQSISHNPFYDMLAARKKKAQKSGHRTKPWDSGGRTWGASKWTNWWKLLIYRDRRGASSSHSSIVVSNNATVHHSQFHMYFYPSFLSLSSHMDVRIFRNCFAARDYYFKKDENEKKISIVTVVKKCTIT